MADASDATAQHADDAGIFSVSGTMNFFSWLICEHPGLWRAISNVETSILQDTIDAVRVDKPVWVTGLARSGSTLLLEILAGAPGVVSQTYKDFPAVFTPYAWNRLLSYMSTGNAEPAERAHRDGILVTLDSPEAMEEPLWMSFFPDAHNPQVSNVIQPGDSPEFAAFLRNHIRKFLAVRNGQRYLAKANYQVTRMEYLLDTFPDARFVVPVRSPAAHIASLMKQHDLFCRGQRANPRARRHLRRVGHFEFGVDRAPVNTGDTATTNDIMRLWDNGATVEGWAAYWAQIYGYVAERLSANPQLAAATCIVHYDDLCAAPDTTLQKIFAHCELAAEPSYMMSAAARIAAPTYYQPDFSSAELQTIEERTGPALSQLRDRA